MDEGRKRVIGIMAAILASPAHANGRRSVRRATRKPTSDKMIAASVQWAEAIMEKIDTVYGR